MKYYSILLGLVVSSVGAEEALLFDYETEIGEVTTPTRLKTAVSKVPASVTVITGEEIKKLGTTKLSDIFRLVPGFYVSETSGNESVIQYHGTAIDDARRMQIFVDGVSHYRSGFSRIDWNELPVPISAIKKIEITRGANAVTYGANAFLASVNIITNSPEDSQGLIFDYTHGSEESRDSLVSYGGEIGNTFFLLSANKKEGDGFDTSNLHPEGVADSYEQTITKITTSTNFETSNLKITASQVDGDKELQDIDDFQLTQPDIEFKDWAYSVIYDLQLDESSSVKISASNVGTDRVQEWQTCLPSMAFSPTAYELSLLNPALTEAILAGATIDPTNLTFNEIILAQQLIAEFNALLPASAGLMCGTANQNFEESHTEYEIEFTTVLDENSRVVYGVSTRKSTADSLTYLNGSVSEKMSRTFINYETKSDNLLINAGYMYEKDEYSSESSPRLALNYMLDDRNSLRFIVSRATRTPDIFERNADWNYRFTGLSPNLFGTDGRVARTRLGVPGLSSEEITSREIGWYGQSSNYQWDVKIYNDSLSELVSQRLAYRDFDLDNSGEASMRGLELEFRTRFNSSWEGVLAYGYNDVDSDTPEETLIQSSNNGSLRVFHSHDAVNTSFQYLYSNYEHGENHERLDLTFSKDVKFGESKLDLSLSIKHYLSVGSQVFLGSRWSDNQYEDDTQIFGKISAYF